MIPAILVEQTRDSSLTFLLRRKLCLLLTLCGLCTAGFALDRSAFTFTTYDLGVRAVPITHGFTASGTIVLRNDSRVAQKNLALQISSTLAWQSIRLENNALTYITQPYESDIDHTGAVSEAIITLPAEVGPGKSVTLQVQYGGTVPADATRLTGIGAPEAVALRNDWDRVSAEFTAVRGVGYVCWYPVSMEAASLSEGNSYFEILGDWKQRHATSVMKVTFQAAGAQAVVANGRLTGTAAHGATVPGEAGSRQAQYSFDPIGLFPPTFALADYTTLNRPSLDLAYIPDHRAAAEEFALASEKLLPFISKWFGPAREKMQVVELADPDATPFDSGSVLFTPLRTADREQLEVEVAHQLAHVCQPAGITRPWIAEGLAHFAQALVRERQAGRDGALRWMGRFLPALQTAEKPVVQPSSSPQAAQSPAAPSDAGSGQPLARATDPTYYGIKAMFVWWMLRDMVGDDALQLALQSYRADDDKQPAYVQKLVEAQSRRDLEWFFDDWVYRDRGLPDFRVATAFSRSLLPGNYSVTVTVENLGNAAAQVPIRVSDGPVEASGRVMVKAKGSGVQRVQIGTQPTEATVNDGSVPESDTSNNAFELPAFKP